VRQCTDAEIAWLAGIIEGEGCITIRYRPHPEIVVKVKMTDEDVISNLQKVSGIGKLGKPHTPKNPKWSPTWTWTVSAIADCWTILWLIRPWMGRRRLARIQEALDILEAKLKKRKTSSIVK
jgi:hypothetical protein